MTPIWVVRRQRVTLTKTQVRVEPKSRRYVRPPFTMGLHFRRLPLESSELCLSTWRNVRNGTEYNRVPDCKNMTPIDIYPRIDVFDVEECAKNSNICKC